MLDVIVSLLHDFDGLFVINRSWLIITDFNLIIFYPFIPNISFWPLRFMLIGESIFI